MGLRSKVAYYRCVEKGSNLTIDEALYIARSHDDTLNQISYTRPEFKTEVTPVHKLQNKGGARPKHYNHQPKVSVNTKSGHSKRKSCYNCGAEPSHPRSECPARNAECAKCGKIGHYAKVCRSKPRDLSTRVQ